MSELTVTVGGQQRTVPPGTTLHDVVTDVAGAQPRHLAVALNGEVVPRSAWPARTLADGDRVEVVTAIQGGAGGPHPHAPPPDARPDAPHLAARPAAHPRWSS